MVTDPCRLRGRMREVQSCAVGVGSKLNIPHWVCKEASAHKNNTPHTITQPPRTSIVPPSYSLSLAWDMNIATESEADWFRPPSLIPEMLEYPAVTEVSAQNCWHACSLWTSHHQTRIPPSQVSAIVVVVVGYVFQVVYSLHNKVVLQLALWSREWHNMQAAASCACFYYRVDASVSRVWLAFLCIHYAFWCRSRTPVCMV